MEPTTKRKECYEFFDNNSHLERQEAIKQAEFEADVANSTARTYYDAWRKDYVSSVKGIKTKIVNVKNEAEPEIVTTEPQASIGDLVKSENIECKFKPVVLRGRYGDYSFSDDGVSIVPDEDFIYEQKAKEELKALEIWRKYYGKEVN